MPTIVQNTRSVLLANLLKLVLQAAYFLVIARALGAQQYGAFVAITSAASLLSPFVANGCGRVMLRSIARDHASYSEAFGRAIRTTSVAAPLFGAVTFLCATHLFGSFASAKIAAMIIVSDFVAMRFAELAGYVFQAFEDLATSSVFNLFVSASRLCGIAVLVLTHSASLFTYSAAYLITSCIACIVTIAFTIRRFGFPTFKTGWHDSYLKDGLLFSAGICSETVYNDVDKTMLASMGSAHAAGTYAAASRIIEVAFVPVRSLMASMYSRMFREGRRGIRSTTSFCSSFLLYACSYSLAATILLAAASYAAPLVLGRDFALTGDCIRIMAVVVVIRTLHVFPSDILTGADRQGLRTAIQMSVAVFNVAINLILIPRYSWTGAALATLGSEGLLAASMWVAVAMLSRREPVREPLTVAEAITC